MEDKKVEYGTYRTSQISDYYGITNKGLEFYEDKGIIAPEREENGRYRVYNLQDCYTMYNAKLFRRCGSTVEETTVMVNCRDSGRHRLYMLEKKKEIDREIAIQKCLSRHLHILADLLEDIEGRAQRFTLVDRPAMYRLHVRLCSSPHKSTKMESEEFALWNSLIPINRASLHFPMEQLRDGRKWLDTGIGNIILKEDFELLGFEKSNRVEYYPGAKCLYTLIKGDPVELGSSDWISRQMDFLKNNDYTLNGDGISRFIGLFESPDGVRRYDELWLPVE